MDALELLPELEGNGFNLSGVLPVADYDARVPAVWRSAAWLPGARSAVLLGCGGSALFRAARGSGDWSDGPDPVDRFTRKGLERQRDAWQAAGAATACALYCDQRDQAGRAVFADFSALAVACGLGVPSRLRILLHPRFGPWWSIRGLLLTESAFEPTPTRDWEPCRGCPAPCAQACPGERVVLESGFDIDACFQTRARRSDCRTACAARGHCVVGLDHRYDRDVEQYFAQSSWTSFARRKDR